MPAPSAGSSTRLLGTADGNVGIGEWIADERVSIDSNAVNPEVVDVLFRTSVVGDGDVSSRVDAMRMRAGWHHTDLTTVGSQRLSVVCEATDERRADSRWQMPSRWQTARSRAHRAAVRRSQSKTRTARSTPALRR